MKIRKNELEFAGGTIVKLAECSEGRYQIDYILSMLSDQVTSSLMRMNQLWSDDTSAMKVDLKLADGTESFLAIVNAGGNQVHILLGNKIMEVSNELAFANAFLADIRSGMDALLSDYKDQKYIISTKKADLRSDLNYLELMIDRYEP